jgi:hypothetical protein
MYNWHASLVDLRRILKGWKTILGENTGGKVDLKKIR